MDETNIKNINQFTALYRTTWPTRFAVVWIWFVVITTSIVSWMMHGFVDALFVSGAVFLGWSITRELALTRPIPALYAPFLAMVFVSIDSTSLLIGLLALVVARIIVGSVGDFPTMLDWVLVAVLAAVTVYLERNIFSISHTKPTDMQYVLAFFVVVSILRIVITKLPLLVKVRDDRRRGWIIGRRVYIARMTMIGLLVSFVLFRGVEGLFILAPVSAALVATGLGGVKLRARKGSASPHPQAGAAISSVS